VNAALILDAPSLHLCPGALITPCDGTVKPVRGRSKKCPMILVDGSVTPDAFDVAVADRGEAM
jgi:hypothetical protein